MAFNTIKFKRAHRVNRFIGTLHCRCKVITLALILVGNFTPALRAIVIDLTYTDYSNSSWEIHSEDLDTFLATSLL